MWSFLCLKPVCSSKLLFMDLICQDKPLEAGSFKESDSQLHNDSERNRSKRKSCEKHKKSPWYSALYPTYKSRSDDFKKIFRDLPADERLVVDYSCAIQRDILIHGRLYASQNFLCFYANIFLWETQVVIRWKDITSITKEKTALVIPNAILIHTETEKHFLTSFATRDKTYLMLFRIWQHALMDQPMSIQEMWHWVHVCYGEELGLTSDDEDYVSPSLDEKLPSKLASEEFFEESTQVLQKTFDGKEMPIDLPPSLVSRELPSSDSSDTAESDEDKNSSSTGGRQLITPSICPIKHEGKVMISEVYPLGVDDLFTLIFNCEKLKKEVMEAMKYTDITSPEWEEDVVTGLKKRVTHFTAPVAQAVGPKTCQVTETQVIRVSKPGDMYVVEAEIVNHGVPYCDSFYISSHLCLTRFSRTETAFTSYSQIKYRKSVWGIVKNFIEKNVWTGLEDHYKCLAKGLEEEFLSKQMGSGTEVKLLQKQKQDCIKMSSSVTPVIPVTTTRVSVSEPRRYSNELALWAILAVLLALLLLNTFLFYKLTALESFDKEHRLGSVIDAHILSEKRSHDQWVTLVQKQTIQHHKEIHQWKTTLKIIVSLLKKAEDAVSKLQNDIESAVNEKVFSALNPATESSSDSFSNKHTEL